ncbi:hypothetical protein OCH239_10765 [Roseivivax halodurans JCM 10272]|uniref:Uncharacterized protein n=1 Tax=Roseivivax halodurans JCM 10272 TaxID=1449350 RepID=X7EDQ2_9RHOB|nr:hypothetical protein [Roseivivax halodurans]ETX13316.1 hypothetical protein OCH239_10765 [Roseivivax halodurans JCM 10272]
MLIHDKLMALAEKVRRTPFDFEDFAPAVVESYTSRLEGAQLLLFESSATRALFDIAKSTIRAGIPMETGLVPFDRIYAEISYPGDENRIAAMVERDAAGLSVRLLTLRGSGDLLLDAITTRIPLDGPPLARLDHPEALTDMAASNPKALQDRLETSEHLSMHVFQVLFAFAALRREEKVVREEGEPLYSRQQRRRAVREGRPLPERTVTRIKLGAEGRNHLAAMGDAATASGKRRAHWVRGHLFVARNGELTWRRPHIRGVGEVRNTVRVVECDDVPSP